MHLNINQKNIIKYILGPCLVIAGAGSGKTKVIVNKIIYLICKQKINPKYIVAITFTNKSAQNIKLQLSKVLSLIILEKLTIATFHSFGLKIIKSEIQFLNINSNFSLFNLEEKHTVLKKLTKKNFNNNNNLLLKLSLKISNWKNALINPLTAKLKSCTVLENTFADYYQLYENYLNQYNKLDFDDLIFIPTTLLQKNKNIKLRWQKKIRYLLIDEYQDTNLSQYNFMKVLNPINFTLVGDDDQSIYSWRGAEPKNLLHLKIDYPTLKIFKLEENYRSSGRILKVANTLISNNLHIFEKKLISQSNYGIKVKVIEGKNEKDEAEKVINNIMMHHKKFSTHYNDYAILYRGNYQSKIFENLFIKNNIPYYIRNQIHIFKHSKIIILIYYLKFIINTNDNFYLAKIINKPNRKIGTATLLKLKTYATENSISLYQACVNISSTNLLDGSKLKALKNFIKLINKIIELLQNNISVNIIPTIMKIVKYKEWLKKTSKDIEQYKNILNQIESFSNLVNSLLMGEKSLSKMTLPEVITYLTLYIEDEYSQEKNIKGVNLMTLHKSKGLEFSFVYIIGLEEGILPHYTSISENNIEEERRLIYVGITRAKKELFLTFAKQRNYNGCEYPAKPSRFLFELPQEDLTWTNKKNDLCKISLLNKSIKRIKSLRKYIKYKKN